MKARVPSKSTCLPAGTTEQTWFLALVPRRTLRIQQNPSSVHLASKFTGNAIHNDVRIQEKE